MMLKSLARPVVAALVLAASLPAARADDFVNQANALYSTIRSGKRSDLVLLPVMAKMDAPPAAAADPVKAALLPQGSAAWAAVEAWAMAAPQRAVLEALKTVTKIEDPADAYAFGQPYGAEAVASSPDGVALIKANLYTDLGDPPLLAGAKCLYLPALDNLASLVNVEATRLASSGKPAEAIGVLIDWLFFARQMADRQLFQECRWGLRTMMATFERIRDVAYVDFRYGKKELTPEQISAVLSRLRVENGFLRLDRLMFPIATKIGAQQVLAQTFTPQGPNANFGQTMAHLAATQRPLRLFAEAARWDQVASVHGDLAASTAQLNKVYDDFVARWSLEAFDPRMGNRTDFEKFNKARYAALTATIPDMSVLFNDKTLLRAHAIGTRCALGVEAFFYGGGDFPRDLAGIRPRYVKELESDPFNPQRGENRRPPLEFFVPVRDTSSKEPHAINVNTDGRWANFQVRVGQDQFVLYSWGPDFAKGWAENVSADPPKKAIGDLILWPPVTSLLRQHLMETGELK